MQYKSTGWKVTVARMLGFASLIPALLCMLVYLLGILLTVLNQDDFKSILSATFFYLVMIGGLAISSITNFWRYPNIRVGEKGLELAFGFYTKHIDWKSIKSLRRGENELFILLNGRGMLLNRLYGWFDAKLWDEPVVVFKSEEDTVNSLEEEIKKYI